MCRGEASACLGCSGLQCLQQPEADGPRSLPVGGGGAGVIGKDTEMDSPPQIHSVVAVRPGSEPRALAILRLCGPPRVTLVTPRGPLIVRG